MDQFKLKKIKATKYEKIVVSFLIMAICFLYLIYPVNMAKDDIKKDRNNIDDVLQSIGFKGTLQKKVVFDDIYVNAIYLNKGKTESHLVNADQEKEVGIDGFIKDSKEKDFSAKEKELLFLKYPSKVASLLMKSKKTYLFEEGYLRISYDIKDKLETVRKFTLQIDYNDISEFLEFIPPSKEEAIRETGFIYDPSKISVSFTFDDGPNGKKTQELIDALEDYKMSATFFMVANKLSADSETVKKVYNSHSEIGYHSLYHESLPNQTTSIIQDEFIKASSLLYNITGSYFKMTRPPYGAFNQRILDATENVFVMWNLDTNDWRYKDPEYIKKYVLDNLVDGSIILFHDSYQTSVDAAKELMETLYLMDVQVLSVSELAKLKGVELQNHEVYYDFR